MLTVYKASAGSGKTYQLAKEYLRNLIGVKSEGSNKYRLNLPKYNNGISETNNRHRFILAITFTNKATEEMKRRIIDELNDLAHMPVTIDGKLHDANYAKDFCRDFGCSREELAEASSKALHQLLTDYNSFNVTTIDSFFQRVLRTFARELDRQGDFAVELNDTSAVQTAVGIMLDDYNRNEDNKELGAWIYNYLVRQISRGAKSNFFNRSSHLYTTLINVVSKICEERFKPYSLEMTEYLADGSKLEKLKLAITKRQQSLIDRVQAITKYTLTELDRNGVTLDQLKGNYAGLRRLISDYFDAGKKGDAKDVLKKIEKISVGAVNPFLAKYKVSDADYDLFVSMFAQIQELYTEHEVLSDIYESIDQLALLRHAWHYLLTLLADNNMVLLSDTNHLLERIIGDDDMPFIYERMGVLFRNFLIDEFQDTSKMQWRNLKPLVANSLSSDNNSLIIGDEKQSIYRFRNSDSSLLHSQVTNHDFSPDQTEVRGAAPGENTNYRSAPDIVKFNNTFFKLLTEKQGITGFENVVQEIAKKNSAASACIRFLPHEASDDSQKDVLDIMCENIIAQHDNGGYDWSDIAILVAKNDEGAEAVDRIINKYPQIPVLSDEALYVRKSHAVQLIIAILKILAEEQPIKPKAKNRYPTPTEISIAMSRFGYFRDMGMTDIEAIDNAIDPQKSIDAGLLNCIEAVKVRKPSSLVALIETIIHELIPEAERKSQISFLNAFQDYVIEFCSRSNTTIRALLKDWENVKGRLSVASAADIDAVKVMTIHKSKGLEFGCVHIPFGSWDEASRPRGQWFEFPKEPGFDSDICPPAIFLTFSKIYANPGSYFRDIYKADETERRVDVMNMTYVAYTRAERELTVYYDPGDGMGPLIAETLASAPDSDDSRLCRLCDGYDADTGAFSLGKPTVKKENTDSTTQDQLALQAADESDTLRIDAYNVYYHTGAEVLTRVENMLETSPDLTSDNSNDTFEIDEEARQRGILLHDMLAHIYGLDDIDDAIHRIGLLHRIDQKQSVEAKEYLTKMLDTSDQRIVRWFVDNDRVLNEQSILLPDDYVPPQTSINDEDVDFRRPDRIVFHDRGVDVIDYKFTTQVRGRHKRQIREYIHILEKMGFNNVKGYLWYPFLDNILEI